MGFEINGHTYENTCGGECEIVKVYFIMHTLLVYIFYIFSPLGCTEHKENVELC